MNDDNKIEFIPEATESTGLPRRNTPPTILEQKNEQTALSIIGLILALPFPILIVILWITLNIIKQQNQALGEGTMNAVFLYLVQFFIVPVLTIASVVIAFKVTMNSKLIAKKIGYISLGVTALGFVILGLFLNNS